MITSEDLAALPSASGVYLLKNKEDKVIYVGKAKNLKKRVRQYFINTTDNREIIPFLLKEVDSFDIIVVTSEKEALILENNLIKKHQPKYNALLKDDKSFCSLMINHKHMWPQVRLVRFKGKPPKGALYFGPYAKAWAAKETLELLRTLFPLRQCSDSELVRRKRPCILYSLKRCVAPCVAKCTKEEYDTLVTNTIDFLKGHDKNIVKNLKKEIEEAAENLEFEKAGYLLKKLQSIEATLEKQRVEKIGQADIDVIGLYRKEGDVSLVKLLFREGKLMGSNDYFFSHNAESDEELLTSFILQNYEGKELPKEIVVEKELTQKEEILTLLSKERKCLITTPQKGEKFALVKMAQKNAEALFVRKKEKRDLNDKLLISLEEKCHLLNYPETIECFDNSNLSGSEMVSSMVVFTHGEKNPAKYRKYKIKAPPSDDYGALKEVLSRRYSKAKEEDNLPDCILIDGGKGHLNLAVKVLSDLDVSTVDVIALSKEKGKHTKGVTLESLHILHEKEPIHLDPSSPLLFFLQKIRDEAHRTALLYQKKRRSMTTLKSALDEIPGIGPLKKKRLLTHFGSVKAIFEAEEKELLSLSGITKKDIENLRKHLNVIDSNET